MSKPPPREFEELYCVASGEGWRCERAWANQTHFLCEVHRAQMTRGSGVLERLKIDPRVKPPQPCSFEGCPRPGIGPTALCETHQNQRREGRTLSAVLPPIRRDRPCRASGPDWSCDGFETHRTGLCSFHQGQKLQNVQGFTQKKIRASHEVLVRDARGYKECGGCGEWLSESCYYESKHTSDKLQPCCKDCYRDRNLRRRFKIGLREYHQLLESQGGVCAICKSSDSRNLAVDHDHSCCPGSRTCGGCVRGLLCESCNTGLGKFRDSEDILNRAINYLKESR